MAGIEIALVMLIIGGAVILVVTRSNVDQPVPVARAIIGIVAGTLGALFILTGITDLIPDSVEAVIAPIGLVAITAGLVILTMRFLAS